MEVILRLVFKIFEEIFAKDQRRRAQETRSYQKKRPSLEQWLKEHGVEIKTREPSYQPEIAPSFQETSQQQEISKESSQEFSDLEISENTWLRQISRSNKKRRKNSDQQIPLKKMIISQVILGPCKARELSSYFHQSRAKSFL